MRLGSAAQTQTSCELTLCFLLKPPLFRPLMPLTEICKRLWGRQIHCSEGATSERGLFDLCMALVSNKLASNRGYLVWLGAICAGIINWPNSGIYGKTCALSLLKPFVAAKCRLSRGPSSNQYPDDELSGLKYNSVFNEHIALVVFFPLQKPLVSHINERRLLQTEGCVFYLSQCIRHITVNKSWTATSSFNPDATQSSLFRQQKRSCGALFVNKKPNLAPLGLISACSTALHSPQSHSTCHSTSSSHVIILQILVSGLWARLKLRHTTMEFPWCLFPPELPWGHPPNTPLQVAIASVHQRHGAIHFLWAGAGGGFQVSSSGHTSFLIKIVHSNPRIV